MLKIAIIGDSLSAVHSFDDNWASYLMKFTGQMGVELSVKNWAVCGHTFHKACTEPVHAKGTKTQVQQCISQGADIVFVVLGINDCLYAPTRTKEQIIQEGTLVYNMLAAGLPAAKIVFVAQAPHNIEICGLIPSALSNKDAVPSSHQVITYLGRSGIRVNNDFYFNQSIPAAKLTQHKNWGSVVTALRQVYQHTLTVNLWKLARLGCHIDGYHLDSFGQMWFAFTILKWLKDNINSDILQTSIYSSSDRYLVDLDDFYANITLYSMMGQPTAAHRYENINQRIQTWFYQQRHFKAYIGPMDIAASDIMQIGLNNCVPNRQTLFGWQGSMPLILTSHYVDRNGNYGIFFSPRTVGLNMSPGTHLCQAGVLLPDGTSDVYEQPILVV